MAKFSVKYARVLKKNYDFDFKLGNIIHSNVYLLICYCICYFNFQKHYIKIIVRTKNSEKNNVI